MEVSWNEGAKRDVEKIAQHIANDSPLDAAKIIDRLEAAAESLHFQAKRGRQVPEFKDLGFEAWREILAPPYRIIYRVLKNVVSIDAVIDSRRQLTAALLERALSGGD